METEANGTFAVYGQAPGTVLDSGIAPTDYAICAACRAADAESLAVVCFWIFLQGGPEAAAKNNPDITAADGITSYSAGRYIGWTEIFGLYPEYQSGFEKNRPGPI